MAEPGDDQAGLDAFAARMKSTGAALQPPPEGPENGRRSTALGMAFRLSTEIVVGVAVGGVLGWVLDRWLGTSPWLLVLFLFCGMAAGLKSAVTAAQRM